MKPFAIIAPYPIPHRYHNISVAHVQRVDPSKITVIAPATPVEKLERRVHVVDRGRSVEDRAVHVVDRRKTGVADSVKEKVGQSRMSGIKEDHPQLPQSKDNSIKILKQKERERSHSSIESSLVKSMNDSRYLFHRVPIFQHGRNTGPATDRTAAGKELRLENTGIKKEPTQNDDNKDRGQEDQSQRSDRQSISQNRSGKYRTELEAQPQNPSIIESRVTVQQHKDHNHSPKQRIKQNEDDGIFKPVPEDPVYRSIYHQLEESQHSREGDKGRQASVLREGSERDQSDGRVKQPQIVPFLHTQSQPQPQTKHEIVDKDKEKGSKIKSSGSQIESRPSKVEKKSIFSKTNKVHQVNEPLPAHPSQARTPKLKFQNHVNQHIIQNGSRQLNPQPGQVLHHTAKKPIFPQHSQYSPPLSINLNRSLQQTTKKQGSYAGPVPQPSLQSSSISNLSIVEPNPDSLHMFSIPSNPPSHLSQQSLSPDMPSHKKYNDPNSSLGSINAISCDHGGRNYRVELREGEAMGFKKIVGIGKSGKRGRNSRRNDDGLGQHGGEPDIVVPKVLALKPKAVRKVEESYLMDRPMSVPIPNYSSASMPTPIEILPPVGNKYISLISSQRSPTHSNKSQSSHSSKSSISIQIIRIQQMIPFKI